MRTKMFVFVAMFVAGLLGEKTPANAAEVPNNMVWIPAGTFVMGSPETEILRRLDETQHQVTISRGFYMSKYETTQREYQIVTGREPLEPLSKNFDHPVIYISWFDATNYCSKLTERERAAKRLPDGYIYRLPTEAEWEYACRAETTTPFHYGNNLRYDMANFAGIEYIGGAGLMPNRNATWIGYTATVGSYMPNAFGLYDMHGNVWEWCLDWYGNYPNVGVTDQAGTITGSERILRGGAWSFSVEKCRSAYRYHATPNYTYAAYGFRPVLAWDFTNWTTNVFAKLPEPVQPTYSEPSKKETGKDSLVVVTHGWQPAWKPVDIEWVDTMTNAISKYLENQGLTDWQVHAYRWGAKAHTIFPGYALDRSKEEGVSFGKYILSQGFDRVHVIAHSAGAGFAQAVSETIKSTRSNIVVHLTFLDPFIGLDYAERDTYGKGADWADSYYSQDFWTSGGVFLFTEAALKYAYNVNVTWLDGNRRKIEVPSSTVSGDVSQTCYEVVSSHGWPYQFYINTVSPNTMFGSENTGFALSKEGGNPNFTASQYKVGKNALRVLGNSEPSCVPNPSQNSLHIELPQDFSKLPNASVIINSPGNVIIHGIDFELRTASPAWLAASIPITNRVNFISLEAKFTSASGVEGLLSVYWETNVIGSIDERMVSAGIHKYTFPIPETATNGARTLGFRLDAFSAIQSSVTVTNVALGFAGLREPFSLSFVGIDATGLPLLQLNGPSGYNYRVETSTNLVDWETTAILVNTNGVVRFTATTTNITAQFYRAAVP